MKEEFLHYVWKFGLFNFRDLSFEGQPVTIVQRGIHNHNAGPDFLDARIKIGDTLWAGHIEIHLKSSDWYRHKHQHDQAYNNVILHLSFERDRKSINTMSNNRVPDIELNGKINRIVYQRYLDLSMARLAIPCAKSIADVPPIVIQQMKTEALVERLSDRCEQIQMLFDRCDHSWEHLTQVLLSKSFGLPINQEGFEHLGLQTKTKWLARISGDLTRVEALLFGLAGFLKGSSADDYQLELKLEFDHLTQLFDLKPIAFNNWKFARMRPAGFPTRRIAQLASLLNQHQVLFDKLMEAKSPKELYRLLSSPTHNYWNNHYNFGKAAKRAFGKPGRIFFDNLILNCVVPLKFFYGKKSAQQHLCEQAIELLEQLAPENNKITRNWANLNIKAENAADSQALIQQKKKHCNQFDCLSCKVGHAVLQAKKQSEN